MALGGDGPDPVVPEVAPDFATFPPVLSFRKQLPVADDDTALSNVKAAQVYLEVKV